MRDARLAADRTAAAIVERTLDAAIAVHQRVRGLDLAAVARRRERIDGRGAIRAASCWRSATAAAPPMRSTS